MQYVTREGDTLRSIATALTLSPEYGPAIANLNSINEVPDNVVLETGLSLNIPDNWLKGSATPGGINPVLVAGIVLAFLLLR